jgi:hypothetical protein
MSKGRVGLATLSVAAWGYAFRVGLSVAAGRGSACSTGSTPSEKTAHAGDEGKAAGCVPLPALLFPNPHRHAPENEPGPDHPPIAGPQPASR